MDEKLDKIMELLAAMAGTMDGYGAKLDAMMPKADEAEAPEQSEEALAAAVEERADAVVKEVLDIRKRADALGVDLPAGSNPAKLRAVLAVALGADPKESKDQGFCRGVIARASKDAITRTDAASVVTTLDY